MIQPPQRLDSSPPVLLGCTRAEIGIVLLGCASSGVLLMIVVWPLLWSLANNGLTAFVIALFLSLMTALLVAWFGIRSLGAMKTKRSPEWFAQRLECLRQRIGVGHPKLVMRAGRWSNLR